MLNQDQTVDVLQKLAGTLHDGQKGFEEAAQHVNDAGLKSMFTQIAQERGQMAEQLDAQVNSMGEKTKEGGSVGAALHRGWLSVRDAVTGSDDSAVVAEAERGEDTAKSNYEDALKQDLPADVKSMVEAQYAKIKASHDKVRDLKHSMEAAKN